jgi:hemerythrin-like metal-binding protein
MPTMYAMDQLRDYIREHFSAEEALMRRYDFPGLNAHIAEHRNFTARLQAMMLDNVHRDNTAELVQFLGDWLRHHLLKSDMEYVPYLTSATQLYERD